MKCPNCNGTGKIAVNDGINCGDPDLVTCLRCGGTGIIGATMPDNDPHPGPHPEPPHLGPIPRPPLPPHPQPLPPHPPDPWDGPHPHPPGPDPWHPDPWHPHPFWGEPIPYQDGTWGVGGTDLRFPDQQSAWQWIAQQHAVAATATPSPAQVNELQTKLTAYIQSNYAGDWQACFAANSTDGAMSQSQLSTLLQAASVGGFFHGVWATKIIAAIGSDGTVTLAQIQAAIANQK